MKKAGWIIGMLLCVLLVLGLMFGPGIWRAVSVWKLAEGFLTQPEQSMSVSITTAEKESLSIRLDWQEADGKRVYTLESGGVAVYCCGGVIYLENGKGYDFSDALPDGTGLLETPWVLYPMVKIQHDAGVWALNLKSGELLPELYGKTLILETGENGIDILQLVTSEQEGIRHIRAGVWDREVLPLPEAVREAIRSGAVQADKDLTEDVLRLVAGWAWLSGKDPLGMTLDFNADCGPLELSDTLELYRSGGISYVEKGGLGVYAADGAVCTADGTLLTSADPPMEAAQLLGLAYQLCLNGDLRCEGDVYRLELDQQGMEGLAYAIAPQARELNVELRSGTLELEMKGDQIRAIRVHCGGSVDVLLASVDVSIGAELSVMEGEVAFTVPQAVLDAIG